MSFLEITEEEFDKKALEFHNLSIKVNDNWEKVEKSDKIYYTKKMKVRRKKRPILEAPENLEDFEVECIGLNDDPGSSECSSYESEILSAEFHLLFHISFQVPVIYFNIYNSDGSLLQLEDIWDIFQENLNSSNNYLKDNMLSIITQAEHPILFRPFFLLHPCKTNDVLNNFTKRYSLQLSD